MSDANKPKPVFDPVKMEQVNVSTDYPMEPDEFEKLYHHNCYCQMAHMNKNGYPIVTPMFYVIKDGDVYLSSIMKYRKKIEHLQENPKVSVTIHNDGSNAKRQKAILIIGKAEVYNDEELKREIHWKIIDKYWWELKTEEERQAAFKGVHTPFRRIIKIVPNKVMSWDFGKMVNSYEPGVWFGEASKMIEKYK